MSADAANIQLQVNNAQARLNQASALVRQRRAEHQRAVSGEYHARGIRDRGLHRDDLAQQYDVARDELHAAEDALHNAEEDEYKCQMELDDATARFQAALAEGRG
jgi:multidrug resistance efflux pump